MITCILIRVSSKEVKWTVLDTSPKLGQDLTLFCNCTVDGIRGWSGGPDDKRLMVNGEISTNTKYKTSIEKHGFTLTILNLTVEDLNISYECSCGFGIDKHILDIDVYKDLITDANTEEESTISTSEKEDLSTVDNLNKTTNGTNDVRGVILYVCIAISVILFILLIIVIVIARHWLQRKFKEKSRRRNSDADDNQTVRNSLLHPDSNPRQSSDADDNQTVRNSLLHLDSNPRQSSAKSNPASASCDETSSGSSLPTADIDSNQRQNSGNNSLQQAQVSKAPGNELFQKAQVSKAPGQSSSSVHIGLLRSSDLLVSSFEITQKESSGIPGSVLSDINIKDSRRSDSTSIHANFKQRSAAENLEPSTSRETSNATDRREIPKTNSHRQRSKPGRSSQYSNNHRDDPASTCPVEKHTKFKDIKSREESFNKSPLNISTIRELAEAGFYYLGYHNNVKCFSCGKRILWKEGQDPLNEEFHINCEHLRDTQHTAQMCNNTK